MFTHNFKTLMIALFSFSFDSHAIFQTAAVFRISYSVSLVHRLFHLSGVVQDNAIVLDNESNPFNGFNNTLIP